MPRTFPVCVIAACSLAVLLAARPSAAPSPGPRDLLRTVARFNDAEWAAVTRGEAVAKIIDTDSREIAVAGAVRIAGSREVLIDRFRDIERLKRSSLVLDTGRFSPVPNPEDLSRVPFEDQSLDLRACRPGDCQVRLSATDIDRFHREVNWSSTDWRIRSVSVWRQVLAGYAAAYLTGGRTAMPDYANRKESLSVASELSMLIDEYGFVAPYSPEFYTYLQQFGPGAPAGTEHALYWTKEDFGVRPILRICHQVIYKAPGRSTSTLIANNQVYADHYLDAALGLTLAIDDGSSNDGFYMITINRARTRSLTGLLRKLVRSTVQNRSREAMRRILSGTKQSVEQQHR